MMIIHIKFIIRSGPAVAERNIVYWNDCCWSTSVTYIHVYIYIYIDTSDYIEASVCVWAQTWRSSQAVTSPFPSGERAVDFPQHARVFASAFFSASFLTFASLRRLINYLRINYQTLAHIWWNLSACMRASIDARATDRKWGSKQYQIGPQVKHVHGFV